MALYLASYIAGGVSTPANALGAPDGTFTTDFNQNTNWTARWGYDPAGGQPSGTQTITARVRKGTNSGDPTLDSIILYQSGVLVATISSGAITVTSTTGQDVIATFDGSLLSGGSGVEIELVTTSAGGSPSVRNAVALDAITWDETLAVASIVLTGNDANQPTSSTTSSIGQTHALSGSPSTQVNQSSTGQLAQTHLLSGNNASQPTTSSTGALTQTVTLTGANVSQGNQSSSGAITQTHSLQGAATTQPNQSSTGAISQTHKLTGASVNQPNTSTTGSIGASSIASLAGASVSQPTTSTSGSITQTHLIAGVSVTQPTTSSTGAIGQRHVLSGSPSNQATISRVVGEKTNSRGGSAMAIARRVSKATTQPVSRMMG